MKKYKVKVVFYDEFVVEAKNEDAAVSVAEEYIDANYEGYVELESIEEAESE